MPEHPVINPEKEKCREFEKLIPYEELLKEAIQNETILTNQTKKEFEDLL